ncbi:Nodulation protein W [Paraburkholderia tropica]|uniref:response regulator transcription factor n=1 Tax=Paraburkholderia TaxID=1822464 RepID=UPI001CB53E85|nr:MULTISPECIES: response regulator [Paraburkholderia]CAG9234676.1 Nodulation protein W [Paraburkholderia tropica]
MTTPQSLVFVVDDDEPVRRAFGRLLGSAGYTVQTFGCAGDFLERADLTSQPACLLLDLGLPDLSGIALQSRLVGRVPIIFVSGHVGTRAAIAAMKAGATDFLLKPVDEGPLLDAVDRALALAQQMFEQRAQHAEIQRRVAQLTPREREVMALVVAGRPNKLVADELGAAEKTIKIHRARVMEKMRAESLAELVRLAERADLGGAATAHARHS